MSQKLKAPPPLVNLVSSPLAVPISTVRERRDQVSYHRLYKTNRWIKMRLKVFARDLYTCSECGRLEPDPSRLVGHHIRQHNGNVDLFYSWANVTTVCKPCHDGPIKDRERQAATTSPLGFA